MKNLIPFVSVFLLFFLVMPSVAQNRLTVDLGEFNTISVSGGIDVELVYSESNHQMSITALSGRPEEVKYEIENMELRIKARPDFNSDDEVKIKVPYTTLFRIESTSGAVVNSRDTFSSDYVSLKAGTGGKIELVVEVNSIEARVSQMADIVLYGRTGKQNVQAGTGGNYLAYDLECNETIVRAGGGSQAKVTARTGLSATANSKGFIGYIGDPGNILVSTSLGGEIAKVSREDAE